MFVVNHHFVDTLGVLITGGYPNYNTAELYLPSSGTWCTLPSLPDKRFGHTVSEDGLLCGGWSYHTGDSCLQWSPDTGSWEAAVTLDVKRTAHCSWTPANSSDIYLMGGFPSENTTTLIKPDGTQEPGFSLEYDAK